MLRSSARSGYTIIEMIVVLAVLTILGAILIPTMTGVSRDTRVKATADILRGMLAEARAHAIERGHNYILSVSPDGTQLRIAPDPTDTINTVDEANNSFTVREDQLPTGVTVASVDDESIPDEEGWLRLATILTDGTCREDQMDVQITEAGVRPLYVQIRGLTGTLVILEAAPGGINP